MHNEDVLDKDVFDVNGLRLGRVVLAREKDGFVLFDIRLRPRVRRDARVRDDVVTLSEDDVVATDFQVSLIEDAAHLLASRPERDPRWEPPVDEPTPTFHP